jgi:hypothetical protein
MQSLQLNQELRHRWLLHAVVAVWSGSGRSFGEIRLPVACLPGKPFCYAQALADSSPARPLNDVANCLVNPNDLSEQYGTYPLKDLPDLSASLDHLEALSTYRLCR